MVCHECGKTVADGDRFCTGCGTRLLAEPAETVAPDAAAETSTGAAVGSGQTSTGAAVDDEPSAGDATGASESSAATPTSSTQPDSDDTTGAAESSAATPTSSTQPDSDDTTGASESSAATPTSSTQPDSDDTTGASESSAATPTSSTQPDSDDTTGAAESSAATPTSSTQPDSDDTTGAAESSAATPTSSTQPDSDDTTGASESSAATPTSSTQPDSDDTTDDRTELLAMEGDDEWDEFDPVWAATAATAVTNRSSDDATTVDPANAAPSTTDLPSTEPITEVWMDSVPDADTPASTPYDFVEREPVASTAAMPIATTEMPVVAVHDRPARRFRFGAVMFLSIVTGLVALASMFMTIVSVTSDTRLTIGDDAPFGFRTGTWVADELADNLSIAGLLIAVTMVAGGVAAAFGWRWGSGLAGGAGLALAGLAGLVLGLAQIPIDAAHEFARIPPDEPFTLSITRDLGYWSLVVGGALGVVLFFASINDALADRRSGLNPWIAALGALATVVAAAGPLLPENLAEFSDNWYIVEGPGEPPALLMAGRLLQLGLLVVTGLVGFLSVRRWGLGVAIGGALPIIWLAISTLFELTDAPVGPGFRNPGATDMHVHGVTIIGVSAVAALSVLAVIAAYDQSMRERP